MNIYIYRRVAMNRKIEMNGKLSPMAIEEEGWRDEGLNDKV